MKSVWRRFKKIVRHPLTAAAAFLYVGWAAWQAPVGTIAADHVPGMYAENAPVIYKHDIHGVLYPDHDTFVFIEDEPDGLIKVRRLKITEYDYLQGEAWRYQYYVEIQRSGIFFNSFDRVIPFIIITRRIDGERIDGLSQSSKFRQWGKGGQEACVKALLEHYEGVFPSKRLGSQTTQYLYGEYDGTITNSPNLKTLNLLGAALDLSVFVAVILSLASLSMCPGWLSSKLSSAGMNERPLRRRAYRVLSKFLYTARHPVLMVPACLVVAVGLLQVPGTLWLSTHVDGFISKLGPLRDAIGHLHSIFAPDDDDFYRYIDVTGLVYTIDGAVYIASGTLVRGINGGRVFYPDNPFPVGHPSNEEILNEYDWYVHFSVVSNPTGFVTYSVNQTYVLLELIAGPGVNTPHAGLRTLPNMVEELDAKYLDLLNDSLTKFINLHALEFRNTNKIGRVSLLARYEDSLSPSWWVISYYWPGVLIELVIPLSGLAWLYSMWSFPGWLRKRRRKQRGACLKCGYALEGIVGGVCPECGSVIKYAPTVSTLRVEPPPPAGEDKD